MSNLVFSLYVVNSFNNLSSLRCRDASIYIAITIFKTIGQKDSVVSSHWLMLRKWHKPGGYIVCVSSQPDKLSRYCCDRPTNEVHKILSWSWNQDLMKGKKVLGLSKSSATCWFSSFSYCKIRICDFVFCLKNRKFELSFLFAKIQTSN